MLVHVAASMSLQITLKVVLDLVKAVLAFSSSIASAVGLVT